MKPPTVPYIAAWQHERIRLASAPVISTGTGLIYFDGAPERPQDRDDHGVLWARQDTRPGTGHPRFGAIHTPRQRHAQTHLLCQVCAGPPDITEAGVLWLLPGTPPSQSGEEVTTNPPICRPCADTAAHACPHLRTSHTLMRVKHSAVIGVFGQRYFRSRPGVAVPQQMDTVPYTDRSALPWTVATQLVRELIGCTVEAIHST
ncbi:hypothetical protein ACIQGZ_10705 [Streptomyces sp. NPDC092296]|uniref:hypothetical protein n=1 Tax=Streptomyces sp. NPDC092296 TaxID=3366012 RepID=UPI003809C5FD